MAQPPIDDPLNNDKKLAKHIKTLVTPGKTKPRLSALEHLRADLQGNEQEKRNLYTRHYRHIWEVYTGEFLEYTQMMLTLKPKPNEQTVNQLLDLLEECMRYVPAPFQKTTTVEMLHTMSTLRHVLYSKNMKSLRQRGLKIVLSLAVEHPKADSIMDLLMYAFDFNPFLPKWNVVRLKYDHESTKELTSAGPLIPRAAGAVLTKEETIEFMNEYFDFIERQKDFSHWFGVTKKFMLTTLFPDLMRKQQQKPLHDETGFKQCPPELQEALFNRFEQWHKTRYNDIGRELWTKDGNPEVVFELYSHSVSLEPSWRHFQERIFNFFHKVLIVDPIPLTSKGQQIEFQNGFFSKLVTCLSAHTLVDETVAVAKIMFAIVQGTCEKKVWDSLDHSIQCTLQASILDITCTVLALVPSEVRGDKGPDNILCPMLIESLFHCWVYTQTDDQVLPGQWALLQDRIRSTWHRPKALELCFQKVCQISYNLIVSHLHLFDYLDKNEERIQKAGKRGAALTPDGRKLAWKKYEVLPSQTPWTLESYVRIWNHLFDIFRNADAGILTQHKSPQISVEVFRCVKQVMYMFIVAEELADFNPEGIYHKFDMIGQFAPWLWRQSQLGDEHQLEKCQVYKALCRLFCRHNQYRYSSLLLSQFYTTIQQGLELNACTIVAYSIIDATVPIFSLALPGANILVPYYLQAISQIFVDSNPPPPRTSERALLCLASLVCYARHFESLDNIAVKGGSTFKFADLKHHLCSIIHFLLERFKGKTEIHISLSMLAVILLEELHSAAPDLNFLAEKSLWICTHISHGMPIPQSALKALETLFLFAHKFEQVDPHLIENIINQVCNAIINTIKDPKPMGDPSETVCSQIETLLVLLLSAPVACFASPQIILLNVTEAASCGIHSPDVKIQECALKLIHNFMNLLHNFPTNGYYDRTSSHLLDETDRNEPLWSNIGDSIFSFYDVLGNNHELGLCESEQLAWIMHCIMYPYSGSVLFRRIAFQFEKYLKIVAPLMVEVWKHATLLAVVEPLERQTIINNMRRLFTTDNPPGVLVPGTTPYLVFETAQDIEDFQKQLMQSLVAHYAGFKSTPSYVSAVETAGRVTCRDPTGSYSWDCEANFEGHPRWGPTPGIVQKLGGPPTRTKFSAQPQFSDNFYAEYHSFVNGNPDLSAYYQPAYTPPQPVHHPVQPAGFAASGGSPTKAFSGGSTGVQLPAQPTPGPGFGDNPLDTLGGLGGMGDLDIGSVLDELDSMLDNELHALADPTKVDPGAINVLDSADPWAALQTVVGTDQTEWQQLEADLNTQLDNFDGVMEATGADQEIDQMFSNFGQEPQPGAPVSASSGNTPRGGTTPVHNQLNLGAVTGGQPAPNTTQTAFVPTQVAVPLLSPFEIPYHRPDWVEEQDVELDLDYLRPEETNPVRCPKMDLTAPPVSNVYNLESLMRYTTDSVYTYDDEYVEWGTQEFTRIREESQPQIEYILMRMEQQEIKSAKALEDYKHNLPLLDSHPTQPHDPVVTSGPLTNIRMFLASLGWLSYEALDDFRLLNNLTANFKHIKGLDGTNGRECVKIALVYVGYGQQNEKDILGNTIETSGKSYLYHEVVKGLFPLVQKDLHTGYAGGLEKYTADLVGDYMPYYSTPLLEMVAHECVKFPSGGVKEAESRKRHIGNDIVHVVWSEHVADYNPSTIISQFGSIVIVVYPLVNGLFRITIARKSDVPNMIGPVVHNMVVRKELLAPLLRQSAFVANQLARTSAGNYEGPFKTRQDKASIVLDKCCELRKFQEIVARVLSPLPKHIEGLVAKTPRAGAAASTPKTPGGSLDSARRNF